MNLSKVAYFAGLLEGDGCLSLHKACLKVYPTIRLCLTDKEPVEGFRDFVNGYLSIKGLEKPLNVRRRAQPNLLWKDTFTVSFEGRRAEHLMRIFYPYWFSHRREQVIRIFDSCALDAPVQSDIILGEEWLAGLSDAEGCFRRKVAGKVYPHFRVNMTDEDIIDFLVSWLNKHMPPVERRSGKGGQEKILQTRNFLDKRKNRKATYYCTIGGRRATALANILKPHMLNATKLKEIKAFGA